MTSTPPAPIPTTRPRRGRHALAWAVGLLLAVPLVMLAVCEAAGWPFLRQPLQRTLADAAQVPVELEGGFKARLIWRPRLEVGQLRVGAGAGLELPHLVQARDVTLAWRWSDVWRWRRGGGLRIEGLRTGLVDAQLQRLADGRASWQLGRRDVGTPQPQQEPGSALDSLPQFGTLVIERGTVELDDRPWQTRLRIEVAGGEAPAAGGPPGYVMGIEGRWRALPLRLQVESGSPLPLLDDGQAAPAVALQVQGDVGATRVGFDGQAAALLGPRRLQGKLRLRGPSLARAAEPLGVTLPQTPPFAFDGDVAHAGGVWTLRVAQAQIGDSRVAGEFEFDSRHRPPRLTGRLTGPRLVLSDLGPAVGTPGPTGAVAPPPPPGRVLPQRRFDLPSLRAMDADVQVAIDRLDFGTDKVAPLRPLRTRVLLDDGVLRLQGLQAGLGASRVAGTMRLDARGEPAHWSADLVFGAGEVADWLPVLRGGGSASRKGVAQGPAPPYLTGQLSGQLQVAGDGRSTAEILGSLRGHARLALRDGSMSHLITEAAGLDLGQALGVLVRGDKPLALQCARMELAIGEGLVRPRLAVLENRDSRIRIEGQIDLRSEALALRATVKPKDASPFSLRTPVTVGGTLAQPVVGVEGERLAGRAVGALTLGALIAPVAALLPFIDLGHQPEEPCVYEAGAAAAAAASAPQAASRPSRPR